MGWGQGLVWGLFQKGELVGGNNNADGYKWRGQPEEILFLKSF